MPYLPVVDADALRLLVDVQRRLVLAKQVERAAHLLQVADVMRIEHVAAWKSWSDSWISPRCRLMRLDVDRSARPPSEGWAPGEAGEGRGDVTDADGHADGLSVGARTGARTVRRSVLVRDGTHSAMPLQSLSDSSITVKHWS